jgi:hypothetical protein
VPGPAVGVTPARKTLGMASTMSGRTRAARDGTGSATGWPVLADAVPAPGADVPRSPACASPACTGDAGPGIGARVGQATGILSEVLATLDPSRLTGPDAAELYGMFAAVERLSMAGRTLLAPRIDESGVWRDGGHRSPAVMLAELEGVSTGHARNTLEVGHRLPELPGTEGALRSGVLSGPKVAELSGAAVLDPGSEESLLSGAADQPLQKVRERCLRARSTVGRQDPVAAVRRIHAARQFSSWTDAEGAFCFQGRDTADRGAKILEQLQHTVTRLRKATRAAEAEPTPSETDRALRADALFLLVTGRTPSPEARHGGSDEDPGPPDEHVGVGHGTGPEVDARSGRSSGRTGGPSGADGSTGADGLTGSDVEPACAGPAADVIDRPPTCSLMVRVDLDALFRGHAGPDEVCEIDNQGPVPVAMARDLANDSFLRLVFHRAGDIRAVSHLGRTVNRRLRTALAHRDRCCVVPGCGVPFGLEIDHVVPFALGGPTELSNLALLCHHHHYLKTYEGWTLERTGTADDGSPTWEFRPQPPFGEEPDPPDG